jgi:hypothetical protein
MKFWLLSFSVLILAGSCSVLEKKVSYEPGCNKIYVDLEKGTVNGIKLNASQEDVKAMFPCFTGETEDGSTFNCGGGVFFLDHEFYFYTGKDYFEARHGFKGKSSTPILSRGVDDITSIFGEPTRKQKNDNDEYYFYPKKYGTLVIMFRKGKTFQFAMHKQKVDDVELCL